MRHHHAPASSETATLEPDAPLSARLKHATAAIHHEVEHGSDINRKIVERSTDEGYRDTYRRFLLSAYGFEKAVLDRIYEFSRNQDLSKWNYPPEAKPSTELILNDMAEVNASIDVFSLPEMNGLPDIHTIAELAGMEYVRRGSRNGNAYIARVVKHNLGFDNERGGTFLGMDGDQVHPVWQQFKLWLDSLELTDAEMKRAVEVATATFKAVGAWHQSHTLAAA